MAPLETCVEDLRTALRGDPGAPDWRWKVRKRLSCVREALSDGEARQWDGWLSARARTSNRARRRLQARTASLAAGILDRLDAESAVRDLDRLVCDLDHYIQRVHDLFYDTVSMELGGSE